MNLIKFQISTFLLFLSALVFAQNSGKFTDDRDKQEYKWVKIGKQIWMAENLKWLPSVSPSSSESYTNPYYYIYDYRGNDVNVAKLTENYDKYGVLYNWIAASISCPCGWHLPSEDEWTELSDYLIANGYGNGGSGSDIAKSMAAKTNWNFSETFGTPGNNSESNNNSGFTALPGGYRVSDSRFTFIGTHGYWWSSTENGSNLASGRSLVTYASNLVYFNSYKENGSSVRCIKDESPNFGCFTDERDGKVYKTVKIGDQTWMAENLAYGDPSGYQGCNDFGFVYGDDKDICPSGWEIPSVEQWQKLIDYVGGIDIAGKRLKSKALWDGTDEYGFNAIPAGNLMICWPQMGSTPECVFGHHTSFWTRWEDNQSYPYSVIFSSDFDDVFLSDAYAPSCGEFIYARCIKKISLFSISGKVLDIDGNPIENAKVSIILPRHQSTSTDSEGNYRFENLTTYKNYSLVAEAEGFTEKTVYNIDLSSESKVVDFKLNPNEVIISSIKLNRNSHDPNFDCIISKYAFHRNEANKTSKVGKDYYSYLNIMHSGLWSKVEIFNNSDKGSRYYINIGIKKPSGEVFSYTYYNPDNWIGKYEKKTRLVQIDGDENVFHSEFQDFSEEIGKHLIDIRVNDKNYDFENPDFKVWVTDDSYNNQAYHSFEDFSESLILPSEDYYKELSNEEEMQKLRAMALIAEYLRLLITGGISNTAENVLKVIEYNEYKTAILKSAKVETIIKEQDNEQNKYEIGLKPEIIPARSMSNSAIEINHFLDRAVLVLSIKGKVDITWNSYADDEVVFIDDEGNENTSLIWFYEGIDKQIKDEDLKIEGQIFTEFVNFQAFEPFEYQAQLHLQYGPTRGIPGINANSGVLVEDGALYNYDGWLNNSSDIHYFTSLSMDAKEGAVTFWQPSTMEPYTYTSSENREYTFSSINEQKSLSLLTDENNLILNDIGKDNFDFDKIDFIGNSIKIDSSSFSLFPLKLQISYFENELASIISDSIKVMIINENDTSYQFVDYTLNEDSNYIEIIADSPGIYQLAHTDLKEVYLAVKSPIESDTFQINLFDGGEIIFSDTTVNTIVKYQGLKHKEYHFKVKSTEIVDSVLIGFLIPESANDTLKCNFTVGPETPVVENIQRSDSLITILFDKDLAQGNSYIIYYDEVTQPETYTGESISDGSSPIYSGNKNIITISGDVNSDYYLRFSVIDSVGSESEMTKEYVVPNDLKTVKITASDSITCSGESILLSTNNSFEKYLWSTSDTAKQIQVFNPGTYFVTAIDEYGYESTNKVSVDFYPKYEIINEVSICEGESYEGWNETGTYNVDFSTINGCDSVITTNLTVHDLPNPDFVFDVDTLMAIDTFSSYQWYDQDGIIEGATSKEYVIEKSGTYYLEIKNENGCSAMSNGLDLIKTGINDIANGQFNFIVIPNPNDGKFRLKFENGRAGKYQVQILNEIGQVQAEKEIYLTGKIHVEEFSLSHLPKGNYFIKVFDGEKTNTKKVILK